MFRKHVRILLILLLILLILTSLYLVILVIYNGNVQSLKNQDYTIYYEETINYMNRTTSYINDKKPALDIDPGKLLKLYDYYVREYNRLLNTRGVKYEKLVVFETYLNLSKTVNNLYNISLDWPSIWIVLVRSSQSLSRMDIEKALKLYNANKPRLYMLRDTIKYTIELINYTKYTIYTPIRHQKVINYTLVVLINIRDLLDEYIKLMELLNHYYPQLDKAFKTGNSTIIKEIGEIITEQLDLEKLDGLINDISDFLSQLLSGLPSKTRTQTTYPYQGGGGYEGGIPND